MTEHVRRRPSGKAELVCEGIPDSVPPVRQSHRHHRHGVVNTKALEIAPDTELDVCPQARPSTEAGTSTTRDRCVFVSRSSSTPRCSVMPRFDGQPAQVVKMLCGGGRRLRRDAARSRRARGGMARHHGSTADGNGFDLLDRQGAPWVRLDPIGQPEAGQRDCPR